MGQGKGAGEMTFNLAGTLISDEARADLRMAKATGQEVIQRWIDAPAGECSNCGGTKVLCFWYYPVKKRDEERVYLHTLVDNELHTVEVRVYSCPVCAADSPTRHEMAWQTSGLEPTERGWRLDYFEGMAHKDQALGAARDLLALTPAPCGWLTLHGDYGMGKSGILKSMVAQFILAGVPAAYVRAADILTELRSSYGDDSKKSEGDLLARFAGYQFLAVDEVDRASSTDWARSTLFALLDRRYNARTTKATALALNVAPTRLPAELGYLASRMTDGLRIPVGGQSLRG